MGDVDLVVKGGKIATPRGFVEGGIAIDGVKIISVSKEHRLPSAVNVIDCAGKVVLPGLVDAHVHVFGPGWIRETFGPGTRAAAVGGVATLLDMPSPGALAGTTVQAFDRKRVRAEREAYVDFGLYGGEIERWAHAQMMKKIVALGAVGFKMITGGPGFVAEDVLLEAFKRIQSVGSVAVLHAEDQTLIRYFLQVAREEARVDPAAFTEFRPSLVEKEAVRRVMLLASLCRNRLHLAHLTSEEALETVRKAKSTGLRVTAETCPHYLLLSANDYRKYGHRMVVTPPIKTRKDSEALWRGVSDGTIDIIASDHCPYYKKQKDSGLGCVWETPLGIPGLETMLPLLLSEGVNRSRISLRRLMQLVCEAPAKIFGLYPRKGVINPGSDADLTVVDLKLRHRVDAEHFECAGDFSPFDDWRLRGAPVKTIVRGNVVAEDGQIVGSEGFGRFVRPDRRTWSIRKGK